MALLLVKGLSSLLPVVAHLLVLLAMDSYKLVRMTRVLLAVVCGIAAAFLSQIVNDTLLLRSGLELSFYSPFVAPFIEEAFKAVFLVYFIATRRVGFLVDGAILGFAVGVGFALTENLLFLNLHPEAGLLVWIVRGFGTAVMHGSTQALLAVLAQGVCERVEHVRFWHFLPGFMLAVGVHSAFNQFFLSPAVSAAALLLGIPVLMFTVFRMSDRNLQKWLGSGLDRDSELLDAINRGRVTKTPVGSYLLSLQDRFPPDVVADMFCLLKLSVELSIEAKGMLMMRKQGFEVGASPGLEERLTEVAFLERNIGPTGRLAIGPLLPRGRKDFWQRQLLV